MGARFLLGVIAKFKSLKLVSLAVKENVLEDLFLDVSKGGGY